MPAASQFVRSNPFWVETEAGRRIGSADSLQDAIRRAQREAAGRGETIVIRHPSGKLERLAKNRKRNPADADSQALADFRGRGPKETLKIQEAQLKRPTDMWAIGDLLALWLHPVKGSEYKEKGWPGKASIKWKPEEGVKLAADGHEDSQQLYIVGGNAGARTIDEEFIHGCQPESYDAQAEFAPLGPVYGIEYVTEKRMDKFIPTTYGHQFGEESGEVPYLWYHRPTKSLLLTGGAYRILGKDRSLGNSPGIAN